MLESKKFPVLKDVSFGFKARQVLTLGLNHIPALEGCLEVVDTQFKELRKNFKTPSGKKDSDLFQSCRGRLNRCLELTYQDGHAADPVLAADDIVSLAQQNLAACVDIASAKKCTLLAPTPKLETNMGRDVIQTSAGPVMLDSLASALAYSIACNIYVKEWLNNPSNIAYAPAFLQNPEMALELAQFYNNKALVELHRR